jgi:hypothetical protein
MKSLYLTMWRTVAQKRQYIRGSPMGLGWDSPRHVVKIRDRYSWPVNRGR